MGLRTCAVTLAVFTIAFFISLVFSRMMYALVPCGLLSIVKNSVFATLIVLILYATGFMGKLR